MDQKQAINTFLILKDTLEETLIFLSTTVISSEVHMSGTFLKGANWNIILTVPSPTSPFSSSQDAQTEVHFTCPSGWQLLV